MHSVIPSFSCMIPASCSETSLPGISIPKLQMGPAAQVWGLRDPTSAQRSGNPGRKGEGWSKLLAWARVTPGQFPAPLGPQSSHLSNRDEGPSTAHRPLLSASCVGGASVNRPLPPPAAATVWWERLVANKWKM